MKNSIRKKILILGLFIILWGYATSFLRLPKNQLFNQNEKFIPRLSQSIDIITPENKTYFKPMSGYYPSTYGFENDVDEGIPKGWELASTGGNQYIKVVSDKFGHYKVLEGFDNGAGAFRLDHYFNATEGTIEFWIAHNSVYTDNIISNNIFDDVGNRLFGLRLQGGNIILFTSGGQITVSTYAIQTWYHVRFDFRSDTGLPYEGLNQNEFTFYLNGVDNGTYGFENNGDPDFLWCRSVLSTLVAYKGFWDGFGFSWDSNYNVGDNLEEGLLLSFENNTTLDWIGYSLDGLANKTILGNATIPMPEDGLHRIQVYCNDTGGIMYQSNIRYFSVDTTIPYISILYPLQDDFFGNTPPTFQISYTELTLNSTWYYLGPGTNNKTFDGYSGTINQTEWNKLGEELVTIRFYINDSGGLENFDEVVVEKELTAPTSIISYIPSITPNVVNSSTKFSLSSDDGAGSGVSEIRYKINNSVWYVYTSPFDLSTYSNGDYLITYQAIDNVGNIESEKSITVSLVKIPSEESWIPGFSLFLVLGLMSLISLILTKKYKKHLKF